MSHSALPASQDVHKNTTTYQIVATVQDSDTWRSVQNPNDRILLPAAENQIDIQTWPNTLDPAPTAVNRAWDSSIGKLTATYTWTGLHTELLESPGQIATTYIKFRGVDYVTDPLALHDAPSAWATCTINFLYVPVAGGGGGG